MSWFVAPAGVGRPLFCFISVTGQLLFPVPAGGNVVVIISHAAFRDKKTSHPYNDGDSPTQAAFHLRPVLVYGSICTWSHLLAFQEHFFFNPKRGRGSDIANRRSDPSAHKRRWYPANVGTRRRRYFLSVYLRCSPNQP